MPALARKGSAQEAMARVNVRDGAMFILILILILIVIPCFLMGKKKIRIKIKITITIQINGRFRPLTTERGGSRNRERMRPKLCKNWAGSP
jgi:hypothetical protein